jgi:hypothetical protein
MSSFRIRMQPRETRPGRTSGWLVRAGGGACARAANTNMPGTFTTSVTGSDRAGNGTDTQEAGRHE